MKSGIIARLGMDGNKTLLDEAEVVAGGHPAPAAGEVGERD